MRKSNSARIEKLEAEIKAFAEQRIWVDLCDDHVRVDIGTKRGEKMFFGSVIECIDWADKQIENFKNLNGLAFISDMSETFAEGMPRDMFYKIYDGVAYKGILLHLKELQGYSIRSMLLLSWLNTIKTRDPAFWQLVSARIDALEEEHKDDPDENEWEDDWLTE